MNTKAYLSRFAALALASVSREYPHKLDHVVEHDADVKKPRDLHPAFFGCFDWHSAVHGHWLLVHILSLHAAELDADLIQASDIRQTLDDHLQPEKLNVENEYFKAPVRASFERPYGWAWLLKLRAELALWDDPDAVRWCKALEPLADTIIDRYLEFFPKQRYPIRAGTHANTAFGLSFAWDYAIALSTDPSVRKTLDGEALAKLGKLRMLIEERVLTYFGADRNYPAEWEPGGDDFLSPSLVEADLVRRVLQGDRFAGWLEEFLPGIRNGEPAAIFEPAEVAHRSDPKIVHLDGLNLSRAWCMRSIAAALSSDDPRRTVLAHSAQRHAEASFGHVTSGDYAGEHWLATFAVYMLSTPEV
jgi:hypothetical protein